VERRAHRSVTPTGNLDTRSVDASDYNESKLTILSCRSAQCPHIYSIGKAEESAKESEAHDEISSFYRKVFSRGVTAP
jgi:phage major head subunit gpT-like protein